jgi:hypothetical protein
MHIHTVKTASAQNKIRSVNNKNDLPEKLKSFFEGNCSKEDLKKSFWI